MYTKEGVYDMILHKFHLTFSNFADGLQQQTYIYTFLTQTELPGLQSLDYRTKDGGVTGFQQQNPLNDSKD